MRKSSALIVAVAASLLLTACTSSYRRHTHEPPPGKSKKDKIAVEAYLFDAKLKRRGKPTSFRLEVFQTDSVIALGGRAYLGKGALKGRLTDDSLEVYFPSSNEYLYESLSYLLASADCSNTAADLNLLHLFKALPDRAELSDNIRLTADRSKEEWPKFVISLPGCQWRLELTYDRQKAGWRIRDFKFDNGQDVSLKGKRRTYKATARVRSNKFRVLKGEGAARIIP